MAGPRPPRSDNTRAGKKPVTFYDPGHNRKSTTVTMRMLAARRRRRLTRRGLAAMKTWPAQ